MRVVLKDGKLWDAQVEQGPVSCALGIFLWCICMMLATLSFAEQELV